MLAFGLAPAAAADASGPPDPVDPDYPIEFLAGTPLADPIGLTLVSGGDVIRFGESGADLEAVEGLPGESSVGVRPVGIDGIDGIGDFAVFSLEVLG